MRVSVAHSLPPSPLPFRRLGRFEARQYMAMTPAMSVPRNTMMSVPSGWRSHSTGRPLRPSKKSATLGKASVSAPISLRSHIWSPAGEHADVGHGRRPWTVLTLVDLAWWPPGRRKCPRLRHESSASTSGTRPPKWYGVRVQRRWSRCVSDAENRRLDACLSEDAPRASVHEYMKP